MSPVKLNRSETLELYSALTDTTMNIPMVSEKISAGFPSPAEDFIDTGIDLNQFLIKHSASTFFGRVKGDSMMNVGISDGDLLIIDKSLDPENGKIAVCFIDGEFTVKRILIEQDKCYLMPENDAYKPIPVTSENNFLIWGIVTHVIKSF